jgi:hypothetical protein
MFWLWQLTATVKSFMFWPLQHAEGHCKKLYVLAVTSEGHRKKLHVLDVAADGHQEKLHVLDVAAAGHCQSRQVRIFLNWLHTSLSLQGNSSCHLTKYRNHIL